MSEDGGDTRVDLVNRLNAAIDRIEALEAALREIMDHPAGLYEKQYEIARAALDKDAGE